jgi:hypothetical protein
VVEDFKIRTFDLNGIFKGFVDIYSFGRNGDWPECKGPHGIGDKVIGILPVGVLHLYQVPVSAEFHLDIRYGRKIEAVKQAAYNGGNIEYGGNVIFNGFFVGDGMAKVGPLVVINPPDSLVHQGGDVRHILLIFDGFLFDPGYAPV